MIATCYYKTFSITGSVAAFRKKFASILESGGLKIKGSKDGTLLFRYPSLFFTSKRPLTYITSLSLDTFQENGRVRVRIGVNLLKIKMLIAVLVSFVCFMLPILFSYWYKGWIDLPPTSWTGVPAGMLLYYHARARVSRMLKRVAQQSGE